MTRDEILNMPAGREMDALVSAIVEPMPESVTIGELRTLVKDWRFSYCRKSSPLGWWAAQIGLDAGSDDQIAKWEPFYEVSKEIDSAWVIVEKMRTKHNLLCRIGILPRGDFWVDFFMDKSIIVNAETAPLAICRAALLAIMESE